MDERYEPPFHMTEEITNLIVESSLGITERQVQRMISKLKRQGKLVRHGASKNGFWEVRE